MSQVMVILEPLPYSSLQRHPPYSFVVELAIKSLFTLLYHLNKARWLAVTFFWSRRGTDCPKRKQPRGGRQRKTLGPTMLPRKGLRSPRCWPEPTLLNNFTKPLKLSPDYLLKVF